MTLEHRFGQRLQESVDESKRHGYNPIRIIDMLRSNTAVEVAKKLVLSGHIQSGLKKTVAESRAELAIESIMLDPEFVTLFTSEELEAARWRLAQAN